MFKSKHFIIQFERLYERKRNFYVHFFYFKAAFDKVLRVGLLKKQIRYQIKERCLRFVVNIYNGCRSRIFYNDDFSEYFPCQNGAHHGENLSPFLYSLYLNDLEDFFNMKVSQDWKASLKKFRKNLVAI